MEFGLAGKNVLVTGSTKGFGEKGAADRLFDESIKALGSLDVLVNNAGIWPTAYVREMTEEQGRNIIPACIMMLLWAGKAAIRFAADAEALAR